MLILFQVDGDTDMATLQAIIEAETGLPTAQQAVFHNGKLIPTRSEQAQAWPDVRSVLSSFASSNCTSATAVALSRQHKYRTTTF